MIYCLFQGSRTEASTNGVCVIKLFLELRQYLWGIVRFKVEMCCVLKFIYVTFNVMAFPLIACSGRKLAFPTKWLRYILLLFVAQFVGRRSNHWRKSNIKCHEHWAVAWSEWQKRQVKEKKTCVCVLFPFHTCCHAKVTIVVCPVPLRSEPKWRVPRNGS